MCNPFMEFEASNLEDEEEDNFLDRRNALAFKGIFGETEISEFWISLNSKFPRLSNKAVAYLLPFGRSFLCEHGFLALTEIKSKKRERLRIIDEEMRVRLSKIDHRISLICSEKHSQISH